MRGVKRSVDVAALAERYRAGETIDALAKAAGVPKSSLHRYLHAAGSKIRPRGPRPIDPEVKRQRPRERSLRWYRAHHEECKRRQRERMRAYRSRLRARRERLETRVEWTCPHCTTVMEATVVALVLHERRCAERLGVESRARVYSDADAA